uniref:Uncharacterized protein n=2 Tax=Arsenophonus nasoniae TaxID=638 RepID=D2TVZ0_9GAMM|nr:hypothetical protein ARN_01970 [Arsenophonus nasoniae]
MRKISMRISPLTTVPVYSSEQLNDNEYNTDNFNNQLLEFDEIITNSNDIPLKQKIDFNSEIMGLINEIENLHDKHIKSHKNINHTFIKELQILKVKFGMVAIKYGDTDWESFGLSQEIFENNNKFFNSNLCLLSSDDQQLQKITEKNRNYVWYCCLYNFAHQLAYEKVEPPADKNNTEYYSTVDELKTKNLPQDTIFAIANARCALTLCEESFTGNDPKNDTLYIQLKEVNLFYDNYLIRNKNSNVEELARECDVLTEIKSLYIAESVINEFKND